MTMKSFPTLRVKNRDMTENGEKEMGDNIRASRSNTDVTTII